MSFLYPFAPSTTSSRRRSSSKHSSRSRSRSRSRASSSRKHKHKYHRSSSHSSTSRAPSSLFSLGPSANRSTLSSTTSSTYNPRSTKPRASEYSAYDNGRMGMGPPSIFSSYSTSSSSRRAKPRSGLVARIVRKIRKLFRNIVRYAKKHPIKVFFMVILPLITGGVLQKLLRFLGVRVPRALQFGRSRGGYDGGGFGGEGIKDSLNGLVSLAKVFV